MFGIDVEKLAIIGTVALIFIGPERLPRVARMIGTLMGRAQRYMADVKAEVSREIQLDELRNMRDTMREAAQAVETTIHSGIEQTQSELSSALATPASEQGVAGAGGVMERSVPAPVSSVKREKWRRNIAAHQSATPLWYRQARRRRTRVLSGAARVARYRARSALPRI